jgi:hemoglobin-like flavoprotein
MTPEQITMVQSSFASLNSSLPVLTDHFYQELFDKDPSLRPMFTTEMVIQKVRFAEKLSEIVNSVDSLDEFLSHTRALGARHVHYGVRAGHYKTVGDSLLPALSAVLGDRFDPATREAWSLAYNLVAETMLEGAAARPT